MRGGSGWSTAGRHPEGGQGGRGATPPPHPPHRPASRGGPVPHPPGQGGLVPPPARERSRSATRPPAPAAGSHRGRGEQASPRQRARTPHRLRPEKVGEHELECYGGPRPHAQNDASDTRIVDCPGKAEGRNEAKRPPALQAPPRPHKRGVRRTPPPPPSPPPRHTNATDPPRGAQPPQGVQAEGTEKGPHTRRPAPTTRG